MLKFTLRISLFLCMAVISAASFAQENHIAIGGSYKQNFDTMLISATAKLPTGWRANTVSTPRTVGSYFTAQNTTQFIAGANMPSPASGGIYNFGAGTTSNGNGDRAVGGLNTSSNPTSVNLFLDLINTGGTITSTALVPVDFRVSYSIEKYRNGTNNDGSAVQLYYSLNGTSWTLAPDPVFTTVYAGDANNNGFSPAPAAGQTRFVNFSFTFPPGTTISSGVGHVYLAWNISVPPSADRKSTRLNSSHERLSRMPSSA